MEESTYVCRGCGRTFQVKEEETKRECPQCGSKDVIIQHSPQKAAEPCCAPSGRFT